MRVSNIPFNLSFINGNGDEVKVHSLTDLSANFNLSDLWKHFLSGNLDQWLKSIDEPQLAEKVEILNGIADNTIVLPKLCEVLGLPVPDGEITESVIPFDDSKNRFSELNQFHDKIQSLERDVFDYDSRSFTHQHEPKTRCSDCRITTHPLPQELLLQITKVLEHAPFNIETPQPKSDCANCWYSFLNRVMYGTRDRIAGIAIDLICALQIGETVVGKMNSRAQGGVDVMLENGLHAFCALRELETDISSTLTSCIDEHKVCRFEVIGANPGRNGSGGQVTLSRRRFWEKQKLATDKPTANQPFASVEPTRRIAVKVGDVVKGVVTGFGNNEDGSCYGVFVNIGNEDGLLHVSEMSSSFVKNPKELFHIGDAIDVKVLSVTSNEDGKRRIALSVRQLKSDDSKRPAPQPNKKAVARQPSPRPNQRTLPRQRKYHMYLIDGLSIVRSCPELKSKSLAYLLKMLEKIGVKGRLYFPSDIKDVLSANNDETGLAFLDNLIQHRPEQIIVYTPNDDIKKCVKNLLAQKKIGLISNDVSAAELQNDVCRVEFSGNEIAVSGLGLRHSLEDKEEHKTPPQRKQEKQAGDTSTNVGVIEGKTVEFKKSIIFSAKTHEPGEDRISEIAETCAAFMNTEGGELYLGVDDKGFVTGIEGDLAYLEKASIHGLNGETDEEYSYSATPDGFQRKLINAIKMYISTDAATNLIDGPFFITDEKSGLTYAKLTVKAVEKPGVIYFGSKWYGAPKRVFVRIGASTEFLEGEDLVTFIQKRFGLSSNGQ